jgi:hypothetical protein
MPPLLAVMRPAKPVFTVIKRLPEVVFPVMSAGASIDLVARCGDRAGDDVLAIAPVQRTVTPLVVDCAGSRQGHREGLGLADPDRHRCR